MFDSSSSNDTPVAVSPSLLADGSHAFVLDYADGTSVVAKVKDNGTLTLEKPDGTSVDASIAFQANSDGSITVDTLVGNVLTAVNVASDATSSDPQAREAQGGGINWGAVGGAALRGAVTGAVGGAITGAITGAVGGEGVGALPGAGLGAIVGAVGNGAIEGLDELWNQVKSAGKPT